MFFGEAVSILQASQNLFRSQTGRSQRSDPQFPIPAFPSISSYTGGMSAVKDRLHELVDRVEPSRVEEAARALEFFVAETPAVLNDAARELRRRKASLWLATHDDELEACRGKWILLEGDQLLGVDTDLHTLSLKAKAAGIEVPFIYRVPPNDLPFVGI